MKKIKLLFGGTTGYLSAALFNAILVLVKETNKAVFSWLKSMFGHHWVGHGILTLVVFLLATLMATALYKGEEFNEKLSVRLSIAVVVVTLISFLIIAGFFALNL